MFYLLAGGVNAWEGRGGERRRGGGEERRGENPSPFMVARSQPKTAHRTANPDCTKRKTECLQGIIITIHALNKIKTTAEYIYFGDT